MTERFRKAAHRPPKGSNAQDPTVDRLAAYPEAGELQSPQGAIDRDVSGPAEPQPAGLDTEIIFTGGPGRSIGGPHATDRPGETPGRPAADGASDEDDLDPETGQRPAGPFVDRLR